MTLMHSLRYGFAHWQTPLAYLRLQMAA
jgi:hypothetical protein